MGDEYRSVDIVFAVNSNVYCVDGTKRSRNRGKKFLGYYHEELEEMYTRAPEKMQTLLKKVRDPLYSTIPQTRSAFFIGDPGTDKTTAAITFAYMLRDTHERELIDCVDFTVKGRGGSTENLRDKIKVLLQAKRNMIIILDEVQELLDHAEDPHYDTASTGRYVKKILNNSRLNSQLFIIATLNDCKSWANHIKSSMRGRIVKFKGITTPEGRIEALKSRLRLKHIVTDPTVDTAFLKGIVDHMEGWSGRDFESFADLVVDEHLKKDNASLANCMATAVTIKAALAEMKEDIKISNYSEQKTEFHQREKHHKEALKANLLSQWLHRAQKVEGNNIGVGGVGEISYGENASHSESYLVTKESLNGIWLKVFPDEQPLEFPDTASPTNTTVQPQANSGKTTIRQHIAQSAIPMGFACVMGGTPGVVFGWAVGGTFGLVTGVIENGFSNW